MDQLQKQADALYEKWIHIDTLYSEYARTLNLTRSSMDTLYFLYKSQNKVEVQCTQKAVCEEYDLPKQTVNTIIAGFVKDGLVALGESQEDRRQKILLLTEKGKEFCAEIFQKIEQAEVRAFSKIPKEGRDMLLSLMGQYTRELEKELKG